MVKWKPEDWEHEPISPQEYFLWWIALVVIPFGTLAIVIVALIEYGK